MSVLFESNTIEYANEAKLEVQNVNIDEANRNMKFEFTKNSEALNPQEAEYSFATKVFSMTPKVGQLEAGDEVVMRIVSR